MNRGRLSFGLWEAMALSVLAIAISVYVAVASS
jgi:heme exporter protein D